MIEVEPKELYFREVRLNQSYTSSLCLTNNQAIAIDISIRPSSNRYHVSPSRVHLNSGQSIIVTVRLHITHFPNHAGGVRGQTDTLQLSSSFFEQRVDVHFFLYARKNTPRSRSLSPIRREQRIVGNSPVSSSEEHGSFEEKSKRALHILRLKDYRINELESELDQLRNKMLYQGDSASVNHYRESMLALEKENANLHKQISDLQGQMGLATSVSKQDFQNDELEKMREKTLDQAEQIEVLISELSRLRHSVDENHRTRITLDNEMSSLVSANQHLRVELQSANNKCSELESLVHAHADEIRKLHEISKIESVDANASTSWRDRFNSSAMDLLKDRVIQAEAEVARLRSQTLSAPDSHPRDETGLTESNCGEEESKKVFDGYKTRNDTEETVVHAPLEDVTGRLEVQDECSVQASQVADAHTWWSYVWHELRNNPSIDRELNYGALLDDQNAVSDETGGSDSSINHLHGVIRSQAIELTALRQGQLLHDMRMRGLKNECLSKTEILEREIVKLQSRLKAHRNDGEIKIAELSKTIQLLSKKSDLHREIAQARDDLVGEKISSRHLSTEVENYRALLQQSHDKLAEQRRACSELKSSLATAEVVKSICHIPGLKPSALIELFSGRIMWLQRALRQRESDAILPNKSLNIKSPKKNSGLKTELHESSRSTGPPCDVYFDISHMVQTPEKLLEVLDVMTMSRKLSEQEDRLQDLQAQNEALEKQLRDSVVHGYIDVSESGSYAIEDAILRKLAAEKELNLCQHALSQVKYELARFKKRATQFELALHDSQRDLEIARSTSHICSKCSGEHLLESEDKTEASRRRDCLDHDGCVCSKCADLAHRLRERTVQLRIVMESLEALQLGNGQGAMPRQNEFGGERGDFDVDHVSDIIAFDIPPVSSGSWETQALVKRIIELTAELSSQLASNSMLERRISSLEDSGLRCQKRFIQSQEALRNMEEALLKLQKLNAEVSEKLRGTQKDHIEEIEEATAQIDALTDSLKEKEYQCQQLSIQASYQKRQAAVAENEAFREWFRKTILSDNRDGNLRTGFGEESRSSRADNSSDDDFTDETVQSLVVSLLVQWREQVGFYPRGATGAISKAEHKFMERITGLVLESHSRCAAAVKLGTLFKLKNQQLNLQLAQSTARLENCMVYLRRYQCRAEACESVLLSTELQGFQCNSDLCDLYQKAAAKAADKSKNKSKLLTHSMTVNGALEVELKALRLENKTLKSKLVAIEDKNGSYARIREEVSGNMEGIISDAERSVHKWIQVELPRLLTGLPITEDSFGMHDVGATLDILEYAESGRKLSQNDCTDSKRYDHVFALSQALCTLKTTQALMESRHCILKERNYVMRERIVELEHVIDQGLNTQRQASDLSDRDPYPNTDLITDADEFQALTTKLISTQAELLKMQKRCDALEERDCNIRGMISKFGEDEVRVINHAANHVSRVKEELQVLHVNQIREISASYELEKIAMLEEINRLTRALGRDLDLNSRSNHVDDGEWISGQDNDSVSRYERAPNIGGSHSRSRSLSASSGEVSNEDINSDGGAVGGKSHSHSSTLGDCTKDSGHKNDSTHSGKEFYMDVSNGDRDAVKQDLALCQNRLKHAQSQVSELEHLLETQRSAFRRHLDMERQVLATSSLVGSASSATSQSHEVGISVAVQADVEISEDDNSEDPSRGDTIRPPVRHFETVHAAVQCSIETTSYHQETNGDDATDALLNHKLELMTELKTCLHHINERFDSTNELSSVSVLELLQQCSDLIGSDVNVTNSVIRDNRKQGILAPEYSIDDGNTIELNKTLLIELQQKIVDIEDAFEQEKVKWDMERGGLMRSLNDCEVEKEMAYIESAKSADAMRQRYQQSLKDAQDALNDQMTAARMEIDRLKEQILSEQTVESDSFTVTQHLRNLLDESKNSFEKYREKMLQREEQHSEELQTVWTHFDRYRLSQEHIVASMQNEIAILEEVSHSRLSSGDEAQYSRAGGASKYHNDKEFEYRRLSELCRARQDELNSMFRTLTEMGSDGRLSKLSSEVNGGVSDCRGDMGDHSGHCPHDLTNKLLQARVDTMEREVSELNRALASERDRNLLLKEKVRPVRSNRDIVSDAATQTPHSLKDSPGVGKEAAETLKNQQSDVVKFQELKKLKDTITELKDQLAASKEENNRKSKLLSSMRETRQAESNAVQLWKHEFEQCEEKMKRCNRALVTKEAVVRDLKTKIRSLEVSLQESSGPDGDGGDLTSLSPAELRKRLKASELERGRARARLSAFRDRIFELESEIAILSEKDKDINLVNEKLEVLRLSNARKDAIIRSQKDTLEKAQVELLSFKEISSSREADFEKHKGLLQRHLKESERRCKQLQLQLDESRQPQGQTDSVIRDRISNSRTVKKRSANGGRGRDSLAAEPHIPDREVVPQYHRDDDSQSDSSGRISANELSNIMSELNVS